MKYSYKGNMGIMNSYKGNIGIINYTGNIGIISSYSFGVLEQVGVCLLLLAKPPGFKRRQCISIKCGIAGRRV